MSNGRAASRSKHKHRVEQDNGSLTKFLRASCGLRQKLSIKEKQQLHPAACFLLPHWTKSDVGSVSPDHMTAHPKSSWTNGESQRMQLLSQHNLHQTGLCLYGYPQTNFGGSIWKWETYSWRWMLNLSWIAVVSRLLATDPDNSERKLQKWNESRNHRTRTRVI